MNHLMDPCFLFLFFKLENRYKGIRSPHKLKGGVSGCIRECAEAQVGTKKLARELFQGEGMTQ